MNNCLLHRVAFNVWIVPQALFHATVTGEPDDDTVHGCFAWRFGVPCERSVRELDPPPIPNQRSE